MDLFNEYATKIFVCSIHKFLYEVQNKDVEEKCTDSSGIVEQLHTVPNWLVRILHTTTTVLFFLVPTCSLASTVSHPHNHLFLNSIKTDDGKTCYSSVLLLVLQYLVHYWRNVFQSPVINIVQNYSNVMSNEE